MPAKQKHSQMRPDTFNELKTLIAGRYAELPGQLKRISEFAIENPNDFALKTVSALADDIGVQPSSIVRFAKTLGYDGFTEMQLVFRSRLVASIPSYSERIQTVRQAGGRAGAPDQPGAVLSNFVDQGIAALDMLRAQTPPDQMQQAVDILARADNIFLLAQRRAFPVSFYMSYALARLDRRCHLIDGVGGLLAQQAALAGPKDALVAVSFRPYSPDVVDMTDAAAERGVPVISITDSALSPIAPNATVAFEIVEQEDQGFRTLLAPMCLAQSLVVSLGHKLAASKTRKSKK